MIKSISEYGAFEVDGHRLKLYLENVVAEVETLDLKDPIPL